MGMSREDRSAYAVERRARILTFITQDPPVPLENILRMEGITDRTARGVIAELEKEHGIRYIDTPGARVGQAIPFGLSPSTNRLRANLANELYRVTNSHNQFGFKGREDAAQAVGLNPRQQIRAENKPFGHDWTLSQIERLARTLGEDPWEFLLKCTTT